MKASVLMTTFNRDTLLMQGLEQIRSHGDYKNEIEIIVLNDGNPGDVDRICSVYGAKHVYTAETKSDPNDWRVPGFALNIGAKISTGDALIITCAEMFHLTNCFDPIIDAVAEDEKVMAIVDGRDDNGSFGVNGHEDLPQLNVKLPFLMGVSKKIFFEIGGYDEDFTGHAWEDQDLVDRLKLYGCKYKFVDGLCVHLFHPRTCYQPQYREASIYNNRIFKSKKGTIVRNVGREWGNVCELSSEAAK